MNKEPIALYEIRVTVETDRVLILRYKNKVSCTGKNYIPIRLITDEDEKDGFTFSGISSRVPCDLLMLVRSEFPGDNFSHIRRSIYYLDGQEPDAKIKIRDDVNAAVERAAAQTQAMLAAWENRKL